MERVGVRRIKIRQNALFNPLILTFSLREKELSILNLMAVKLQLSVFREAGASYTAFPSWSLGTSKNICVNPFDPCRLGNCSCIALPPA
jgi:hypothetical protein